MSNLKKKLAVLFAAMLAAGTIWVGGVSAASPVLSVSSEEAGVGETVTVTVSISQNPGINWSSFYVQYDHVKLQLVGAQNGEVMNSWDSYDTSQADGSYLVTTHTSTTKNTSKDGTMAILSFKVLSGAAGDKCVVSLSPKECYTDSGSSIDPVPVVTYDGSITVSASHSDSDGSLTDVQEPSSPGTSGNGSSSNSGASEDAGQENGDYEPQIPSSADDTGDYDWNHDSDPSASVEADGSADYKPSTGQWIQAGTSWYYLSDGEYANGWKQIDNVWYCFDAQGKMLTGWQKLDNTWYYLQSSGVMATGWQKIDGVWYYLKPSGAMATGWQQIDGIWYYLKSSGAMATSWQLVDGTWYYLNGSGAMKTGWLYSGNHWYYLSGSGAMKIGWVEWQGSWYYMGDSGAMLTNAMTPDGYWVNEEGIWIN